MVNIIVVEDDEIWMNKFKKVINNIRNGKNIDFKFKFFHSYTEELKKYIKLPKEGNTFYIIDIILRKVDPNSESGIDLISDIRDIDKTSLITLVSSEPYLISQAQKKRLNIYDYIYKDDRPLINLEKDLNEGLELFGYLSGFKFKCESMYYNLKYSDINYIQMDGEERKLYIYTLKNKYNTRMTLKKAESQLPFYFTRINKDIIININNIKKINFVNEIILFKNKIELNEMVTKSRRKGVKELCGMK